MRRTRWGRTRSKASTEPLAASSEWTEADLLQNVRDLARELGWKTIHHHRSDHSEAGWPDLFMVKVFKETSIALAIELKRDKTKATMAQREWLEALRDVPGIAPAIWRPKDLDEIASILSGAPDIIMEWKKRVLSADDPFA